MIEDKKENKYLSDGISTPNLRERFLHIEGKDSNFLFLSKRNLVYNLR